MKKNGYMTMSENVDVEITIYVGDVCEFIEFHASSNDLSHIRKTFSRMAGELPENNRTLIDDMKSQLLIKAHKEMSLEELERRLEMTYI